MDEALLRAVNGWSGSPFVAGLGIFFSSLWLIALVPVPIGAYLLYKRRVSAALAMALAMGGADTLNTQVFKPLVDRQRPCRALTGLVAPAGCGPGQSFPSGHAAVSFAFLTSTAPALPGGWLMLTPIVLLASGSRVLLGVHYPSDVAAGALFGAAFGFALHLARKRVESRDSLAEAHSRQV